MAEDFQLVTTEPKPAQVDRLESELSALWLSTAQDPHLQHPVTRSCSLTLLVYVESEEDGREVTPLIDQIAPQRPCRAVIMMAEPEAKPEAVSAHLSARCLVPGAGHKEVCYERISLLARGEAVAALDQVVMPLMVPGLPVYFWWRAGRFLPPRIWMSCCAHAIA